jgi:hypothetical protein
MKNAIALAVAVAMMASGCTSSNPKPNTPADTAVNEVPDYSRMPSAVDGASQDLSTLSRSVLSDRRKVEDMLAAKAHIMTRDTNFEATGTLKGEMSGEVKMPSTGLNLKNAVIGALLGGLGAGAIGGVSTILGSAMGLQDLMLASGLVGGVAGALMPGADKLSGSMKGSIDGKYEAKGWENQYEGRHFVITVVDPQLVAYFGKLPEAQRSNCLNQMYLAQKAVVDSGRYFTPTEAVELATMLERVRRNVNDLQMIGMDLGMNPETSTKVMDFANSMSTWLNKRLSVVSMGRHDLGLQTEVGSRFAIRASVGKTYALPVKTELVAYIPGRNVSTPEVYKNVIGQWSMQSAQIYASMKSEKEKYPNEMQRGTYFPDFRVGFDSLQTNEKGIFYDKKIFGVDPAYVTTPQYTTVMSLTSGGVSCRSKAQANELMNQTSRMVEMFFGYVDVQQAKAMLSAGPLKTLNATGLTNGDYLN